MGCATSAPAVVSSRASVDKGGGEDRARRRSSARVYDVEAAQAALTSMAVEREEQTKAELMATRAAFLDNAAPGSVHDHYAFDKMLGSGGFAIVVRGTNKQTGEKVAVKIMRMPGALSTARPQARRSLPEHSALLGKDRQMREEDALREIEVLRAVDHPCLLKLHSYFLGSSRDKVYIVTELLRGGELLDALLERGNYSELDARTIFKSARRACRQARRLCRRLPLNRLGSRAQILQGVEYLHSKRIAHRDLKLENLLLADRADLSSVRIADFGMAHMAAADDPPNPMTLVCGTPAYVAPEVATGRAYGCAVDMWSAGVILFILLSGVVPFPERDERKLFINIARGEYSVKGPEWVWVSDSAKALVTALMCISPTARLTATAALAHPWMSTATVAAAGAATALSAAQGGLRAYAKLLQLPVRIYPAGAYLIQQGDIATEVLFIRRGRCDVILRDETAGWRAIKRVVAQRGPGEFVGEMGLLMSDKGRIMLPAPLLDASASTPRGAAEALHDLGDEEEEFHDDDEGGAADVPPTPRVAGAGYRTASVVATEETEVMVLRAQRMRWMLENDNSVRQELHAAILQRQRELRVARDLNAAERAAAVGK